ncbi:hypothetical protein JHK85_012573 [Glycine max]|nr:hypothetical protein JHK85_012573 [Glycine max]
MATTTTAPSLCHHSNCDNNPLFQSHNPSFPYFLDWTFDFSSNLSLKVPIINPNPTFNSPLSKNSPFTNPDCTSAGLEQTLPWIFYHKVIRVSSFLVFIKGDVTRVLETTSPDPRDISPGTTLWSTNKSRKTDSSTLSHIKLIGLWDTRHMLY